jgi:sterol 14-demethylase
VSPDHIRLPFVAIAGPDELPVDDVAARSPNPPKFAADHAPPFDSTRTVPVFHKRITFLIGPKVSEHFFKARDTEMSQKEVYEFNVPTFGKGVVFDVDHITRAEQFRFFANSLKSDRLRQYVGMMVKEAEDYFAKWGDEGEVDLLDALSELIVLTASRCLLGREIRETLFSEVTNLVHDLDKGMVPLSVFFPYAPIEAHRKRDKARKELAAIFDKVIQGRRESGAMEPDVLQTFIDARYKDGSRLSNDQVLGMLIAVLFAGQHTSSITSTWTGLLSIANKERIFPKLEKEQKDVMAKHGDKIDFDILAQMDELHFCIKEALRMHPPLIMLLRQCNVPFEVETTKGKKFVVPKGHIVATSPAFAHRMDEVYSEPNVYKPERFKGESPEDKRAYASFIGFGSGRHGCMGETFAYMQIKTIWSHLLRNFDFELVGKLPEPDYEGMVVGPKHPCTVRYKRRKL